jgi:hypothetical protein
MPNSKLPKMTDKELVRALFSKTVRKTLKTAMSAESTKPTKKKKKK